MRNLRFLLFAPLLLFAQDALRESREPVIQRSQKVVFFNHECVETQSCDLKRVEYVVEKYSIDVAGIRHYGKRFLALYETDAVEALPAYTFIQFIRGCRYRSWVENGDVKKEFSYIMRHGTEWESACFPHWVVDTDNAYPDYCADPDGVSRHSTCRWKENMAGDLFSHEDVKLYGEAQPAFPALYIVDRPSNVYALGDMAANNSFLLRTCLYKTADVPRVVDLSDTQFAEPLFCFEWHNTLIYNHATGVFEESPEIVPDCCSSTTEP